MEFKHEFIDDWMKAPDAPHVMVGLLLAEFHPEEAKALTAAMLHGLAEQEIKMMELTTDIVATGIHFAYERWLENQGKPKSSIGGN